MALLPKLPDDVKDDKQLMDFLRGITQVLDDDENEKNNIVSKMKQGSGSGLNADLLRGLPADFTASKTSNGYQKLPSGLIIQWGWFDYIVDYVPTSGILTVSFPITFPSQVYVVYVSGLVGPSYGSHPSYSWYSHVVDRSKFKFFWNGVQPNWWGGIVHYFIAIGS